MIIQPEGLTATNWCNRMTPELQAISGLLPIVMDDDQWRVWASVAVGYTALANAPNPNEFEDWERWAYAFVSTLGNMI